MTGRIATTGIVILRCAIFSILAAGICAAQTPTMTSVRYAFTEGKKYVYRSDARQFEDTDAEKEGLGDYVSDNYSHIMRLSICAKDIDANGAAQLLFTIDSQRYEPIGDRDARSLIEGIRGDCDPVFEARLTPAGSISSIVVLEESEETKKLKEEMNQPGRDGNRSFDSVIVALRVQYLFPSMPSFDSVRGRNGDMADAPSCRHFWATSYGLELESVIVDTVDEQGTPVVELRTVPANGEITFRFRKPGTVDFEAYSERTRFRKSDGVLLERVTFMRTMLKHGRVRFRWHDEDHLVLVNEEDCK